MHQLIQRSGSPALRNMCAMGMLALLATGCRQTTGVTPGSPLTPVSPMVPSGMLSPIQPTSAIGPMGGATRVPPPSTGSYTVPNNYMGGQASLAPSSNYAPQYQTNDGWRGDAVSPASASDFGTVGSGVQPAGGAAFSNGMGNSSQPNMYSPDAYGNNNGSMVPNNISDQNNSLGRPRTGGMQVIDLTNAPPPPGYRSSYGNDPQYNSPQFNSAPPIHYGAGQAGSAFGGAAINGTTINGPSSNGTVYSTPGILPPLQSTAPGFAPSGNAAPLSGANDLPDPRMQADAGYNTNSLSGNQAFADATQMNDYGASDPVDRTAMGLPTTAPVSQQQRSNLQWRSPSPRF
ncbi:hypothetical protein [Stieleria varia]|uniref:Uncharacterized protein n=1 Tax=Stieleria varia TaxID=2528005 RepID=A0A5C6A224_9BACT|nr:hypothetical protein [Stieleria varia]TWT93337.1 hypothetical protein Pla52n_59970 [Stieleria varia]